MLAVSLPLFFNLKDSQSLIWLNGISVVLLCFGHVGSLVYKHNILRVLWLIVTLNTQVILTTWLMADAINSSVFCFVSAALALVIF
jgi:hypothetical protein